MLGGILDGIIGGLKKNSGSDSGSETLGRLKELEAELAGLRTERAASKPQPLIATPVPQMMASPVGLSAPNLAPPAIAPAPGVTAPTYGALGQSNRNAYDELQRMRGY